MILQRQGCYEVVCRNFQWGNKEDGWGCWLVFLDGKKMLLWKTAPKGIGWMLWAIFVEISDVANQSHIILILIYKSINRKHFVPTSYDMSYSS